MLGVFCITTLDDWFNTLFIRKYSEDIVDVIHCQYVATRASFVPVVGTTKTMFVKRYLPNSQLFMNDNACSCMNRPLAKIRHVTVLS